jgi:broad specificity phosphatase PhoE
MGSSDRTTVVLVRHGESQVTVDEVVGGHASCSGLSKRGRRQAEALRDRLLASGLVREAVALYASVLPRAVETASVIAPAVGPGALEVEERCDLCELHVGEGDGLTWTAFGERYGRPPWDSDPSVPLSPGSESWSGFVERASAALGEVADRHAGQMVVVACHGGVIEASFSAWGGLDPTTPSSRFRPENTALTIWSRRGDRRWRLERYNDSAHLDGQEL